MALARLRHPDVIEIVSVILEHLVKGEVMQMKPATEMSLKYKLDYYITKTFYKTASLIANSCKAMTVLAGHERQIQEIAYEYGKGIGIAFQIMDDLLDIVSNTATLGKPVLNDLQQGVITAPLLYAAEKYPELNELIDRKFSKEGDRDLALNFIQRSEAIQQSRILAEGYVENAIAAIMHLVPSSAQSALISLANYVLTRQR